MELELLYMEPCLRNLENVPRTLIVIAEEREYCLHYKNRIMIPVI